MKNYIADVKNSHSLYNDAPFKLLNFQIQINNNEQQPD